MPTGLTLKRTYQPGPSQGQCDSCSWAPPPNRERSLSTADLRQPIKPRLKIKPKGGGKIQDTAAAADVSEADAKKVFLEGLALTSLVAPLA